MEKVFDFEVNNIILRGILHLPKAAVGKYPAVVLCHGFMGTKVGMHRIFVKAARAFSEAGFAVLRFDFSGCGDSDGDHENITLDRQIEEAKAAVITLSFRPEIDQNRIFLLGLSLGGCVSALVAPMLPDLKGVILWAPVVMPHQDIKSIVGDKIFDKAVVNSIADYQGFALGGEFVKSLSIHNPVASISKFNGPLLLIHGTGDVEIPFKNSIRYAEHRKQANKNDLTQLSFIENADHTFSSLFWEKELFSKTIKWMASYSSKKSIDRCTLSASCCE